MIHTLNIFAPSKDKKRSKKGAPPKHAPLRPCKALLQHANLQVSVRTPKSSGLSNIQLSINTNISTSVNNNRRWTTTQAKSTCFFIFPGFLPNSLKIKNLCGFQAVYSMTDHAYFATGNAYFVTGHAYFVTGHAYFVTGHAYFASYHAYNALM